MSTNMIVGTESQNIFNSLQDSFQKQFVKQGHPIKRNEKGEVLCQGFGRCEYKQEIAEQCDQCGADSLTEQQQYLLHANVCCCGEFDDV